MKKTPTNRKSLSKNFDYQHQEEIDLFQIIEELWLNKYKIFIVTIIVMVAGALTYLYTPKSYKISSEILPAQDSVFTDFYNLNTLFNEQFGFSINSNSIFDLTIANFKTKDELRNILESNDYIKSLMKDVPEEGKSSFINEFSKKFSINKPLKNETNWNINIEAQDSDEAMKIFEEAMTASLLDLKKTLIQDVEKFISLIKNQNDNEIKKLESKIKTITKIENFELQKRILRLSDQAMIARELGIDGNRISEIYNNTNKTELNVNINDTNDTLDYLRGYVAIEKELEILKSRTSEELLLLNNEYLDILTDIENIKNDPKSSQLFEIQYLLENSDTSNWIYYDLSLSDIENLKHDFKIYILISFIIGLSLSTFYFLIKNAYFTRKISQR